MKYQPYDSYKDSGVEWLGKIPSHWGFLDGKRVFDNIKITAFPRDKQLAVSQKHGVIPQDLMMEINDAKVMLALKGTDAFRHVERNDFVISLRSFEGGIEHSHYDGCVSPAYTVLRPSKKIYSNFFKYLFKSKPYISALQSNTDSLRDGKSISYEKFGLISLPLPSLHEQEKLTHFLDHETAKIDTLIAKQERLIELLKEKRQAVISRAVTNGLDPTVPMRDSGFYWLKKIPKDWKIKKLKYILISKLQYGANESGLDYDENLVRYIRISDFSESGELSDKNKLSLPMKIAKNYLLKDKDILFARSGATVGKAYQFRRSDNSLYCFAGYLIRAELNEKEVLSDFLYYFTQSKSFKGWKELIFNKATIENIGADKYAELAVSVPEVEDQKKIVSFLNLKLGVFDQVIEKAGKQIRLLKERRTALISAAVTGKIDVRQWQAPVTSADTCHP